MNACSKYKSAIGCQTNFNGTLKPNSHVTKYVKIRNVIKCCVKSCTLYTYELGLFKMYSKIQFALKTSELVWGGI